MLELAIVAAIASCVASVTTDTWNGVVQSEKKIIVKNTLKNMNDFDCSK